jgi:predicted AAA+ superfamily ATPase
MAFPKHTYVSLENPDIREAIQRDPRTFFVANKNKNGIIIDEFQHIPELLSYIQTIADEEKNPGYFILTGSQNFLMNQHIAQSLAGRVSIHTLLPLSIRELTNAQLLPEEIEPLLFNGCYPGIYSPGIPASELYRNYVQTYLERDVRLLSQVGDLSLFQTFITLCAGRVGQLVNLTSLGNDCGISDKTVTRWLSILEASYVIYLMRPHHTKLGKRLIKSPKLYFYDPGLACYLLRIKEQEIATHPLKGGLFETFIIADILKNFYHTSRTPHLYFWQDKVGHEVDCLIDEGSYVIPVEVKASRTIKTRFFEGLNYWYDFKATKDHNGFVVYLGSEKEPKTTTHLISWKHMNEIYDRIPV